MGIPIVYPSLQTVRFGDIAKFKCYFPEEVTWGPRWNNLYRIEHDEWEDEQKSHNIIFVVDNHVNSSEKCEYQDTENRFKLFSFAQLEKMCLDDDIHFEISRSESFFIYNSCKLR